MSWVTMLAPRKVQFEAKKKESENLRFRTYLKCHANEEELDQQFLSLHNELFEDYDCNCCRNCCKMYYGQIPKKDIEQDAKCLGITPDEFVTKFLDGEEKEGKYKTQHKPCDFLQENGTCKLGCCKPEDCKNYPYTNQPERLWSLYSVLDAVSVCPVAFEIYERLKKEYGFNGRVPVK